VLAERLKPASPDQGYKRFYHLPPMASSPPRKVVVRPYEEKRRERLGVTDGKVDVDTTQTEIHTSQSSIKSTTVVPDIDISSAEKLLYFGREAKLGFYEFYRQLLRKVQCLDTNIDSDSIAMDPKEVDAHFDEIVSLWDAHLSIDASSNRVLRPQSPRSKFIIGCVKKVYLFIIFAFECDPV
jgi:hypothetical protein